LINFEDNKQILRRLAQVNFWAFCCYYDFDFFHVNRRFLKEVAINFQEVIDEYKKGNAISVGVCMPPRAGKSYITSLFATYWLSQFPELSVMRNSCTSTLYQKFSYDTRNIICSQKFREVFPKIRMQPNKQNLDGWNLETSKQVGYFGAGVGGTIIGFGANLSITDDLYKSMQDALSTNTNNFVKLWKESAHDSRKEKNCPEIYIGTRWTKKDILGEVIEKKQLHKLVVIPALIDNVSFCEDVKSTQEYLKIKEQISNNTWNAEYMQQPNEIEGLLIPFESLKFADCSKLPRQNIQFRFAVGDPADTGGDKYSMPFIDVLMIDNSFAFYVKDIIHSVKGIEANTERIIDKMRENETEQVFIESNGVGLAAVLLIKKMLRVHQKLSAFPAIVNKEVRILSHFEFVQKYFIFDENKYKTNDEYRLFITDLCSYSKEGDNKNKKDAIDVLCSAAAILKIKYAKIIYGK
jgi:hypothetical protein